MYDAVQHRIVISRAKCKWARFRRFHDVPPGVAMISEFRSRHLRNCPDGV